MAADQHLRGGECNHAGDPPLGKMPHLEQPERGREGRHGEDEEDERHAQTIAPPRNLGRRNLPSPKLDRPLLGHVRTAATHAWCFLYRACRIKSPTIAAMVDTLRYSRSDVSPWS